MRFLIQVAGSVSVHASKWQHLINAYTEKIMRVTDFNFPKGTTIKKLTQETRKTNTEKSGKNEDSVPKPTSGLGILFGITNSMVVIEFLLKLKTFPELWRAQLKNLDLVEYNNSVKKLCLHLNNRFDLKMTEFEMRLSIQRVKDWYYLMLQSIEEHKKDPNNTEPYQHRFPIYFKILSKFLTPDAIEDTSPFLYEVLNKTSLATKTNETSLIEKSPDVTTISAAMPSDPPNNKNESQDLEVNPDSLIEFDADTLYDQESSDDEVLETFDESIFLGTKGKKNTKAGGKPKRRYTKVYRASFECEICRKLFKRNCDLKRHSVLHLPPQFDCKHCGQKFYHKYWAEKCTHVKNKNYPRYKRVDKASGEKRIWPKKIYQFSMICEICGNSYRSIGSLNTHKRDKHFNQKFRCVVCNFTALSNWLIERHQRKRHIVEPGLPEDVAKKSRARTTTETKTTFSNEARQAFNWRREMRKTMKPGEKFFGCCRCKIIFNTRKEKILHNKIEHPITEHTVICLLCLPNRLLLSNSNAVRRHYIVIHKVPWYEIDGLVKGTKPIFSFLNKEEIELLNASENYKELLDELLKDKKLQLPDNVKVHEDKNLKAVQNLPNIKKQEDEEDDRIEVESIQEENMYIDGIVDHNENDESAEKQPDNASMQEHDYSEEHVINESFDDFHVVVDNSDGESELYSQQSCGEADIQLPTDIENNDNRMQLYIQNDQGYLQNIVEDYVEYELVEESVVVEEYVEEIIGEGEVEFV